MHFPVRLALAAACALAAPQARAALFCVDTGIELEAAIEAAAINGVDDEIRIAAGTIKGSTEPSGNSRWAYEPGGTDDNTRLDISGGWSPAASCTQQSLQPDATQLDAEFQGQALVFAPPLAAYSGQISVRNLLVTRGRSINNSGAALYYGANGAGSRFTLERTVIVASKAEIVAGSIVALSQNGGGQIRMLGNVVTQNSVLRPAGGVTVTVACDEISLCFVNNNSIYDNYVSTNAGHFGLVLNGLVNASNNAVAGNTVGQGNGLGQQAGFSYSQNLITLRNNHFQSEGFGVVYAESGTTLGDPKWTHAFLYVYPDVGSPLLNSGLNAPLGGVTALDIDGDARIQQGTIERGAIEMPPPVNAPPTLQAPASVLLAHDVAVGTTAFAVAAADDGKPGPLTLSLGTPACFPYGNAPFLAIDGGGTVRIAAPIPEEVSSCLFKVTADDGQFTAASDVLVHVNDPPQLVADFVEVSAELPVGSSVWQLQANDDGKPAGGVLTYQVLAVQAAPAAANPFAVAADGAVTVAQSLPAQTTQFTLTVKVCDAMPLCGTGTLTVTSTASPPPVPGAGPIFTDSFE